MSDNMISEEARTPEPTQRWPLGPVSLAAPGLTGIAPSYSGKCDCCNC
jgi:hypothetical protein